MKTMSNKDFIRESFGVMFSTPGFNEQFIRDNVSADYEQHADGKVLHFDEFLCHIKLLKERTESIRVTFKTLVEESNVVFSNHLVECKMPDGTVSALHVIAEFRIHDGQMCYCDELSHLVTGSTENRDLGSAY